MRLRTYFCALALFLVPFSVAALSATSYIVTDMQGTVILEKNADISRPIASITKLFVAEAAIKADAEELLQVTIEDVRGGRMRSSPLVAGRFYTRHQLLELALISSDNVAALALARHHPPSTHRASLFEGSGLDARNRSSARELAAASIELAETQVGVISTQRKTSIGNRSSTNPLLGKRGWEFILSKTGFINLSGGCLTVIMKVGERLVAVTILGSSSVRQRWADLIEIRRMLGDRDFYVPEFKKAVKKYSKKRARGGARARL